MKKTKKHWNEFQSISKNTFTRVSNIRAAVVISNMYFSVQCYLVRYVMPYSRKVDADCMKDYHVKWDTCLKITTTMKGIVETVTKDTTEHCV